jgi:hypothetical protein
VLTRVTSDDRAHLLKCLAPGGRCSCGEPAVVCYVARGYDRRGQGFSFSWPRCGFCPGTVRTQGVDVRAIPVEAHHRALLVLLGDEAAFLAACRLGYRPDSYDEDGLTISGKVDLDLDRWDETPGV